MRARAHTHTQASSATLTYYLHASLVTFTFPPLTHLALLSDTSEVQVATKELGNFVTTIPELRERIKKLEAHTNIAWTLLEQIKARQLDNFYALEEVRTPRGHAHGYRRIHTTHRTYTCCTRRANAHAETTYRVRRAQTHTHTNAHRRHIHEHTRPL